MSVNVTNHKHFDQTLERWAHILRGLIIPSGHISHHERPIGEGRPQGAIEKCLERSHGVFETERGAHDLPDDKASRSPRFISNKSFGQVG